MARPGNLSRPQCLRGSTGGNFRMGLAVSKAVRLIRHGGKGIGSRRSAERAGLFWSGQGA